MYYTFPKHVAKAKTALTQTDPNIILNNILSGHTPYTTTYHHKDHRITVNLAIDITDEEAYYRRYIQKIYGNQVNFKAQAILPLKDSILRMLEQDEKNLYTQFHIPKHSGGMRTITAPTEELKQVQRSLLDLMQKQLQILPHTAAHAYSSGRSTVTAMRLHQSYRNNWFTKLDIKDFFPSFKRNKLAWLLSDVFPFRFLLRNFLEVLEIDTDDFLRVFTYNDELPQGAPTSPYLTNMLMVPFDYHMMTLAKDNSYCYTRYADDLLISCKEKPSLEGLQDTVESLLNETTDGALRLNKNKTRLGSRAGRNWNLGIMLNEQNKLTIGSRQQKRCKAMVHSFLMDLRNNIHWDILDIQKMAGQIAYYNAINPEFIQKTLTVYTERFAGGANFHQIVRTELNR
jgi:hypothetical protein